MSTGKTKNSLMARRGVKVSLEQKERTLEVVSQEYRNQAMILGQVKFQAELLQRDMRKMQYNMRKLNDEANKLAAAEQAKKQEESNEKPA